MIINYHLIAKLRKNKKADSLFSKVLSTDKSIFEIPDLNVSDTIEYSPDCNISEGEWFKINCFASKKYCLDFLKVQFSSIDYKSIGNKLINHIDNIEYIYSCTEEIYCFQKISKSKIIRKKILSCSNEPKIKEEPLIVISGFPDAIYDKNKDTLFLKVLIYYIEKQLKKK